MVVAGEDRCTSEWERAEKKNLDGSFYYLLAFPLIFHCSHIDHINADGRANCDALARDAHGTDPVSCGVSALALVHVRAMVHDGALVHADDQVHAMVHGGAPVHGATGDGAAKASEMR